MYCLVLFADTDDARLEKRLGFFDSHGFRCLSARTGSAALETAASYKPHVVVINEDLPEVQGTDVCLRIKQEDHTEHAWVIMMGDDPSHEQKFVSEEVGADAFLQLSASDDELMEKIHELLKRPKSSVE